MSNPNYQKVEGHPNLVRDKRSKAILNTNIAALEAYRKNRDERLKIKKMLGEFETVKSDVAEIKDSLKLILDKLSN